MGRKTSSIEEFEPARVRPLPKQPRKRFSGIKELADSITEIGQSNPGIVTLVTDDPNFDAQLVDGERRLRACKLADVMFRAEVKVGTDEIQIFAASFAANFGRQDHDAIEIAESLWRLQASGMTQEKMAKLAGHSACWVSSHLQLLKLHPDVQAMMVPTEEDEGAPLTFAVAQMLVTFPEKKQISLAKQISEGMSYAAARRLVLRERGELDSQPTQGAKRKLSTVESILEDLTDRIGIYLDMHPANLNVMIDAIANDQKRLLAELLRDAAGDLEALAEAIEKRFPVLTRRAG